MPNLSDVDLSEYSYKDVHEQKYNYCIKEYAKRILMCIFSPKLVSKDAINVSVLTDNTWRLNGACVNYDNIFELADLKLTDKDFLNFNAKVTEALNNYSGKYVNNILLPEYEITNSVFNDPIIHKGEFDAVFKFKLKSSKKSNTKQSNTKTVKNNK